MKPRGSGRKGPLNTVMLLDSNVFLEVELAEQHAEACKHLLSKVRDGVIKSAITDFHVDSNSSSHGELRQGLEGYSLIPSLSPSL
jgi:hypothetical protein